MEFRNHKTKHELLQSVLTLYQNNTLCNQFLTMHKQCINNDIVSESNYPFCVIVERVKLLQKSDLFVTNFCI